MPRHHSIATLGLLTLTLTLTADQVRFDTGDALAGDILHFTQDTLFLHTPHASEPLQIIPSRVSSLLFDQKTTPTDTPANTQILKLANGDTLHGQFQSLDPQNLTLLTPYAGTLTIPRKHLSALYFKNKPANIIYSGPRSTTGWTETDHWDFDTDNRTLFSTGQGQIARKLDLPDQFTVSTTFSWKTNPNLHLYICASENEKTRNTSSYYLSLNSAGLAFHRRDPAGRSSFARLIELDEKQTNISSLKGTIELRVNRRNAKVTLLYNGKNMGTFRDPSGSSPKGSYIIINSATSGHRANTLEQIEIRTWDANSALYHSEKPSDPKNDSLTTTKGERFTGEILHYTPAKSSFTLNHPHSDKPVLVSSTNCSVIHFKKSTAPKTTATSTLNLTTGSSLTLTPGTLDQNGTLTAKHPLIGDIRLKRHTLQKLTRRQNPQPKK